MLGIILMITAAVAGSAGPESSSGRPVAQQPSKPIVVEGNRRVCHETQSTGSLFTKRVCKTVDQWQQDIAASQAFAAQRAREMTTYQQMQIQIQKDKDN